MDSQAATTVIRGTLVSIPMGTIGTRMSTTIRMPGIHLHIIPRPQVIGIVGTGLTTVSIAITTTIEQTLVSQPWK